MKNKVMQKGLFWIDLLVICILIGLDQYTKNLAIVYLKDKNSLILWKGVFELRYLENRGAAFGILKDQRGFFILIACTILVVVLYVLFKLPVKKRYAAVHILLVMVASGAVGNMIDRISLGYVVDFFYFSLINFPIFNVADIYVTIGCILLAVFILFYYKDDEFDFLNPRKKQAGD